MRLSDFKGEEAIDALADIIEPITAILSDKKIFELSQKKARPIEYVQPMLKEHKTEVIAILARLENKTVEEYKKGLTLVTLPMQVLELINDPEIQNLFHSQEQSKVKPLASSSPATETTEAEGT